MKCDGALPPLKPKARPKRRVNAPRFDVRAALYYVVGLDLTEIEGVSELTALTLISEIGPEVSKFATVKKFCSWLGLCPNWKKTGEVPCNLSSVAAVRCGLRWGGPPRAECRAKPGKEAMVNVIPRFPRAGSAVRSLRLPAGRLGLVFYCGEQSLELAPRPHGVEVLLRLQVLHPLRRLKIACLMEPL